MSFRINTNINAMNALRNLGMTGMEASKSTTRLSTGLRINSGADDPSGLIASESYRAQLSGIDQALRNNQDALNFSKTAEGGLDEVNRLLRDARSLAVANGNGTLDSTQKQANQTQLNSILASIDRIASNTAFGTKKLLNGSAGTRASVITGTAIASASFGGKIGLGAVTAADAIDVDVTTAATIASHTGTRAIATGATAVGAGSFTLNGKSFSTDSTTTRDQLVAQLNAATAETGVQASVNGTNNIVLTQTGYGSGNRIDLVDANGIIQSAAGVVGVAGVDAVATVSYTDGTSTFTSTFNKGKGLELKDADGNTVNLRVAGNAVATLTNAIQIDSGAASFQIGGNAGQTASLSLGNFGQAALGFTASNSDISGTDMSGAMNAIDAAISKVADARGKIGSFMKNTLESNVRSLGIAKENLAATESSIREIDVAEEMTNYTKLQILQQSGLSMLAQANQAPQSVLSLLR
ncbi:MAG: flagellin [Fimbriimonadaceae bacterium]|nr:MAG: flagellin [Fimbriimonadaceae bacterium]